MPLVYFDVYQITACIKDKHLFWWIVMFKTVKLKKNKQNFREENLLQTLYKFGLSSQCILVAHALEISYVFYIVNYF